MSYHPTKLTLFGLLAFVLRIPTPVCAGDQAAIDYFEKEIRPLFIKHCNKCHGDTASKGGLRLNSRASVLHGGDSGPAVVAGKPAESLLLRAVRYQDDLRMPPKGKLTDREIQALTRWVQLGLPWPEEASAATVSSPGRGKAAGLWSLQPIRDVAPPTVKNVHWPRSTMDSFVLAALEARGLPPAPPADKRTLIRRVTFDLIGLPPTPEEIDAFLADTSADAFTKVVDRLLTSRHYGERWGRHWLDVVRYADASGRVSDFPEIWRYRDWVTESFNRDLPYTEFLKLQFAGDLLQPRDPTLIDSNALIATGMLAIAQFDPGTVDPKLLNATYVDDQIDVLGRAVLGLTLACARCHDHKYDPISTEDYYALAGIFFNTRAIGALHADPPRIRVPLLPKTYTDSVLSQAKYVQNRAHELQVEIQRLESQLRHLPAVLAGQTVGWVGTPLTQAPFLVAPLINPAEMAIVADNKHERIRCLRSELDHWRTLPAPDIPQAVVVQEGGHPIKEGEQWTYQDARIYVRGDPQKPGRVVPRRFPIALAGEKQEPITQGSGRLQLARWLTSPRHPLTPRVLVNRLWHHHFGEGIVRTPNNFGEHGERPTHPELLDYLAVQFVQSGWSLKAMHRLMLLSATYQQSSFASSTALQKDPENRLWGRMNRHYLEAEAIRDSLLAVTGRLDLTVGGPGFMKIDIPRRTHYLMTVRSETTPSGFNVLFDRPDPNLVSEKRLVSTVAPQALFLLNDSFVIGQAKALAARLAGEARDNTPEKKIQRLYSLCFGRTPTLEEMDLGRRFLAQATTVDPWQRYCQLILCTNEFVVVD